MRLNLQGYRIGRRGQYFPEPFKRRQRFQVAVRTRVRRERWAQLLAMVLVAFLGVGAMAVARHYPLRRIQFPKLTAALTPQSLRFERAVIDGAPPALQDVLARALGPAHSWGLLEPYRAGRRLEKDFPCLSSVRFERQWTAHQIRFIVDLRRPLARVTHDGQPWGWLSETGRLFTAPAGTYPDADWVEVDFDRGGESDAAALAGFLRGASEGDRLPATLVRAAYRSPAEGWKMTLSNETELLWGHLNWTDQKFSRLKEILADARVRGHDGWAMDLRYFEEGKILMRPKL